MTLYEFTPDPLCVHRISERLLNDRRTVKFDRANVLVVGAYGFIGSYTSEVFKVLNYKKVRNIRVLSIDNGKSGKMPNVGSSMGVSYVKSPVNRRILKTFGKFDLVFFCSGIDNRHTAKSNVQYLSNMYMNDLKLISEFCSDDSTIIVMTSGDYGSFNDKSDIERQKPIGLLESSIHYSMAMLESMQHIRYTFVNSYNVFGPGMDIRKSAGRVTSNLVRAVAKGGLVKLYKHGSYERPFTFIEDFVVAMFQLVMVRDRVCVVNIANKENLVTVKRLSEEFSKFADLNIESLSIPSARFMKSPQCINPGTERSETVYGIQHKIGIEEAVERTAEWAFNLR